ncbi:uncharacterized protein LOC143083595 isoform X2 [Mytilus galloprovincialis]
MTMNQIKFVVIVFLLIISEIHDAYSITVRINQNISGVIDESGTQIKCSFTRHNVIKIFAIEFKAENETIVTILPDDKPRFTTKGQYLEERVTVMNISKYSTEAILTFVNLNCMDQINYSCSVVYLDQNSKTERRNSGMSTLFVKVPPSKPDVLTIVSSPKDVTTTPTTLENATYPHVTARQNRFKTTISQINSNQHTTNDGQFKHEPSFNSTILQIGDEITFICTGNVGNPSGVFIWQKYRHGENPTNYTNITTTIQEVSDMCSYNGTSTLAIHVTAEDNQAIIRCILNSTLALPNVYTDTIPLEVQFPDYDTTIESRRTTLVTAVGNDVTDSTNQQELQSAGGDIGIVVGFVIPVLVLLFIIGICLYKRTGKKKASRYQVNEKVNISQSKQPIHFKQVSLADNYEKIPLKIDTGKETTTVDIDDIKKQNMVYIETQEKDDENKFST